jgi:hypothetical protein
MPSSNLTTLAQFSPRTDNELIALTQGTHAEIADLALALWHERAGLHRNGCDVCCLEAVDQLAGDVLEAANLVTDMAVILTAQPVAVEVSHA